MPTQPHKILLFLFLFMVLVSNFSLVHALTEQDFISYEDYYFFDFDSTTYLTESGYISINGTNQYNAGVGYGWQTAIGDGYTRDRATPASYLLRDLHLAVGGDDSDLFLVDVADGWYNVTFFFGDIYASDYDFLLEGQVVLTVNFGNSVWNSSSVEVYVDDGQLTMGWQDSGASGNHDKKINGLIVEKGVLDLEGWLEFQDEENFSVLFVFVLIFFCVAIGIAVSYSKR